MIKLNDTLVSLDIAGEYVIVEPETGRYLASNIVAHEMMSAINSAGTEGDALRMLSRRFDVDLPTLSQDFTRFQSTLLQLGIATAC